MLRHIDIRNFAIIENFSLNIEEGMTAITGETGAGKSIIIDALDIALGDRANHSLIRHGAKQSDICIEWDVTHNEAARAWLTEQSLPCEETCIIRRVIASGRTRNFINDCPVSVTALKTLGNKLINIHGQHEQHNLLKRPAQRSLLDRYLQTQKLLEAVRDAHDKLQSLEAAYKALQAAQNEQDRLAFLQYQLEELCELQLEADEYETLSAKQKLSAQADGLIQFCQSALDNLTDSDNSILNQLYSVQQALAALPGGSNALSELTPLLEQMIILSEEARLALQAALTSTELDPETLVQIEARLSLLHGLARKHRVKPEALLELQDKLQSEVDDLSQAEVRMTKLEQEIAVAKAEYLKQASTLSKKRQSGAKKLAKAISTHLQTLLMPESLFGVELTADETQIAPHGIDTVTFTVTSNPGHPAKPIAEIASGGELSRISLAIELITANQYETPTLVFDEVDVGIGGQTASVVGKLLRQLGERAQVICITHLPQVAASAHHHARIAKATTGKTTSTHVTLLSQEERVKEIARMAGDNRLSETALAHAREMLEV